MLNICKYIRILSKIFSASSKEIKHSLLNRLNCRIASYTIQLVTTGNPVNSYLTSTVGKTNHGPVIALFSVQLLQISSYTGAVQMSNLFTVSDGRRIYDNLFNLQRSSQLPQKSWHHSHNTRKWLKEHQSHFH